MEKVVKVDGNYIENMITDLINVYNIPKEILAKLLGVREELIENYRDNETEINNNWVSWENKNRALDRLSMLSIIPDTEPDFRFRAFLEVLIEYHNFSAKTIGKLAHIEEIDVINFLNEEKNVSIEVRYRLAAVIMMLRFLFKDLEP